MKKMQIFFNPYTAKFSFRYSPDGKSFQNISPSSSALSHFTDAEYSLCRCAKDVLCEIDKYGTDSDGIEITFFGTAADCADVKRIYEASSFNNISDFIVNESIVSAEDAIAEIESSYCQLQSEFPQEDPSSTKEETQISNKIARYNEASKAELNVIVIGTYSSGKSTFINALIGEELLPDGLDPTTGQISKIFSSEIYSIKFAVVNKQNTKERVSFVIQWEGNASFRINTENNSAQCTELCQMIKDKAMQCSSTISQMHAVIKFLDDDRKNKERCYSIDQMLIITLPFKINGVTDSELAVNIFDTPGSDATTAPQHLDVLRSALSERINALPLLLVKRDDMAGSGTNNLRKLLDEYSANIDVANALVVITRGDELTPGDLEAGIDTEVRNKWHFMKLLYASSLAALWAKRGGNLSVGSYREKYIKNSSAFDPKNELYCELYKFAELPLAEKDFIVQEAKKVDSPEEKFYRDCGFWAVEYEIGIYAKSTLNYVKAGQRCRYLLEALDEVDRQIQKKAEEVTQAQQEHLQSKKQKEDDLKKKIAGYIADYSKDCTAYTKIRDTLKKEFGPRCDDAHNTFDEVTRNSWAKIKKEKGHGKDKQYKLHEYMCAYCDKIVKQIFSDVFPRSEKLYTELSAQISRGLHDIIEDDSELSEESKLFFRTLVDQTPIFSSQTIPGFDSDRAFSDFLFLHWINPKKYCKELKNAFDSFFMDECIRAPFDSHKKAFIDEWLPYEENHFLEKLDTMIAIKKYVALIKEDEEILHRLKKRKNNLSGEREKLTQLLTFPKEVICDE